MLTQPKAHRREILVIVRRPIVRYKEGLARNAPAIVAANVRKVQPLRAIMNRAAAELRIASAKLRLSNPILLVGGANVCLSIAKSRRWAEKVASRVVIVPRLALKVAWRFPKAHSVSMEIEPCHRENRHSSKNVARESAYLRLARSQRHDVVRRVRSSLRELERDNSIIATCSVKAELASSNQGPPLVKVVRAGVLGA